MYVSRVDSSFGRTHHEDEDLVRASLGGDPRAAARIVGRYTPLVRGCLAASFAGADLEDQTQEVFLRCFAHLRRLREPRSLRGYLIGIALRCATMERRRLGLRRREALTRTGEIPEQPATGSPVELTLALSAASDVLRRLSPQASRLLALRFVEERELVDLAADLRVSLATAKRKLGAASLRARVLARRAPALAEYVREGSASTSHPRRLEVAS